MNDTLDPLPDDDLLDQFPSEGTEAGPAQSPVETHIAAHPGPLLRILESPPPSNIEPRDIAASSDGVRVWQWPQIGLETPWLLAPLVATAVAGLIVALLLVRGSDAAPSDDPFAEASTPPTWTTTGVLPVNAVPDSRIVGTTLQSEVEKPEKPRGTTKSTATATATTPTRTTTPPPGPSPRRPDANSALSRSRPPVAVPPAPPSATPPPDLPPPIVEPVERPVTVVASESPREAPPPPEPVRAPPARTAGIQAALSEYGRALGALDAAAVKAIWPSADVKTLTKAFGSLRQQSLRLDNCRITPTGSTAEATCTGTTSYVPKMGNQTEQVERRQWQFRLREQNDAWLIERVEPR